ncbi:hypothetical protein DERP_002318 [Dermatophagoides pteronyssinus]|uniref:Uncharacterized protein n=1 Tax=Dermatophagoides pteronyssinus TaxID=6956 RepID=A0ABQ8JHD5_DERPT|nr:hypothetical protein DERP_002318 [Dermatophagoides pteronyssinus]
MSLRLFDIDDGFDCDVAIISVSQFTLLLCAAGDDSARVHDQCTKTILTYLSSALHLAYRHK